MKYYARHACAVLTLALGLSACRKIETVTDYGGFPEEIGEILVTNCATSGCHDQSSFVAEGRLSLETWDQMFQGSRAGAAVVPYWVEQSYLLNFINTDTALGLVQLPTMPLNLPPLSKEDYLKVRDWVAAGAPSATGQIMWSDRPGRGKFYVVNQGCDQVSVFDRDTRLVMRYVDVGAYPGVVENPHNVKVSPDGRYWYLVFLTQNPYIEKYNANTDQLAGRVEIGAGSWNTIDITADGKYGISPDLTTGRIVVINLETMTLHTEANVGGAPHGVRISRNGDAIYFTQQEGSEMNKLSYSGDFNFTGLETIDLVQHIPRSQPMRALGPHEMLYTPDGSRYLVTCQYQDEVRIFQSSNDSLLAVIHTGTFPSEIDFWEGQHYAFVTCMEDTTMFPGDKIRRSSVAVIDYQTMQLVTSVYAGYQSHGVAVDAEKGLVYITNRNVNANGPAPHHSSSCGGRNGNVTAIQLSSLTLLPGFKHEVSVDPYSVGLRK